MKLVGQAPANIKCQITLRLRWYQYRKIQRNKKKSSLFTVTIVPLDKHDLLRHVMALLNGTESKHVTNSRIRLLVPVRNSHSTSSSYVEPCEFTSVIDNSDEPNVVCKQINVVVRRHCDSDFVL